MIEHTFDLHHCEKRIHIRSLPAFGPERYSVSLHIQSECGEIRTKKTPNTDTFYAVHMTNSGLVSTVLGSRDMFRTLSKIKDRGF